MTLRLTAIPFADLFCRIKILTLTDIVLMVIIKTIIKYPLGELFAESVRLHRPLSPDTDNTGAGK